MVRRQQSTVSTGVQCPQICVSHSRCGPKTESGGGTGVSIKVLGGSEPDRARHAACPRCVMQFTNTAVPVLTARTDTGSDAIREPLSEGEA